MVLYFLSSPSFLSNHFFLFSAFERFALLDKNNLLLESVLWILVLSEPMCSFSIKIIL